MTDTPLEFLVSVQNPLLHLVRTFLRGWKVFMASLTFANRFINSSFDMDGACSTTQPVYNIRKAME
jgi:hypothetical protein